MTGTQNSVTPTSTPATPVTNGQDIQGGPNTVLRVIVEHMVYPISLDILHLVKYKTQYKTRYLIFYLFIDIPTFRKSTQNRHLHQK